MRRVCYRYQDVKEPSRALYIVDHTFVYLPEKMRAVASRLPKTTGACTALGAFASKETLGRLRMVAPHTAQVRSATPASLNAEGLASASHLQKVANREGRLRPFFFGRGFASPSFGRKGQNSARRGTHASSSSQEPRYKALTVDIGGTFLKTSVPVAEAYAEIGKKYGEQHFFTPRTSH